VMYLFVMGFNTGDLGYASAIGWMLVVILLALTFIKFRFFRFGPESGN
jgi:ABC-type sugar transport system permease subunit